MNHRYGVSISYWGDRDEYVVSKIKELNGVEFEEEGITVKTKDEADRIAMSWLNTA